MLSEGLRRISPKDRGELPAPKGPKSGESFPWTLERASIQEICEAGDDPESDGAPYGDLAGIEGIEVLEGYDPHNFEDCVNYALGRVMGEEWARDYFASETLRKTPHRVFSRNGFKLVSGEGKSGDVIAYGFSGNSATRDMSVNHVGIYQGEGVVHSKFSEGPVLQHRWDQVPFYGDKVFFFRKVVE